MRRYLTILLAVLLPLRLADAATDISAWPALTSPASGDLTIITDISDTSASAQGTTKKITLANLSLALTPPFSNLTSKPTTLAGYSISDAQPLDADLTAIAALTTTSFGRSLLDDSNAAAALVTLGLDRDPLTTTGLTGLTGGSGKLDGVDISGYTEGQAITFKLGDVFYRYRVIDTGTLPTESSPTYIRADVASGTKAWVLDYASSEQDGSGDTLTTDFGAREVYAAQFVGPITSTATRTSGAFYPINIADVWNAGGETFEAIFINITDTASAAASKFADWQVGGVSKFSVTKAGAVTAASTIAAVGAISSSAGVSGTTGTFSSAISATNATLSGTLIATPDAKSGAGALSVTTLTTKLTTTGADALTLADGANGQIKIITMVVDGGDGTITPATKTGFASVTQNDVGDSLTLQFHTTLGWMVVSNYGCTVTP